MWIGATLLFGTQFWNTIRGFRNIFEDLSAHATNDLACLRLPVLLAARSAAAATRRAHQRGGFRLLHSQQWVYLPYYVVLKAAGEGSACALTLPLADKTCEGLTFGFRSEPKVSPTLFLWHSCFFQLTPDTETLSWTFCLFVLAYRTVPTGSMILSCPVWNWD